MNAINAVRWSLLAWYAVLWVGGVVSYAVPALRDRQPDWTGPVFLLTASLLVLATCPKPQRPRLILAALLGWALEVLGVHTGFPFGGYAYTAVLGPGAFGVPFAMVSAWLILLAYAQSFVIGLTSRRWTACGIGALWLVGIDLVIDPLAGGDLRHWVWDADGLYYGVPLTNFAGWFGCACLLLAVAGHAERPVAWHLGVGASVLAFFTVLAAEHGLAGAAAIGLGLMALQAARRVRAGRRSARNTGKDAPRSLRQ